MIKGFQIGQIWLYSPRLAMLMVC